MFDIFGEKKTWTINLLSKYWSIHFLLINLLIKTADRSSSKEKFAPSVHHERFQQYISFAAFFCTRQRLNENIKNIKNVKKH